MFGRMFHPKDLSAKGFLRKQNNDNNQGEEIFNERQVGQTQNSRIKRNGKRKSARSTS
jgi:hypothetical protein